MRGVVLCVPDGFAVLCSQLGILNRNGRVHRRMAGDIGGIVCQRAKSKGVLVRVLALQQQFQNEVTAANVVHQIAELHTAKRIVAKILNDGAAIRISVGLLQLVFR